MSPNVHPKLAEHLEFLMQFLQIHFKSLNYDAQQLHSLLSTLIKFESAKRSEIGSNSIIQKWKMEIEDGNLLRIERLLVDNAEEEKCEDDGNKNGHDFLINTNQDERFVISLSTDCEEICVWDIKTWVIVAYIEFYFVITFFKMQLWKSQNFNWSSTAIVSLSSWRFWSRSFMQTWNSSYWSQSRKIQGKINENIWKFFLHYSFVHIGDTERSNEP